MQAKIDWYKEILELDPSSKVFFPLARLLAEAGQVHEALDFLREGVARHPDFLEARFFCLELSARLGEEEAVAEDAACLGELLGRYPMFWKAWAQNLSRKPETRDAALALDFISVHFRGTPVSWGEVIQRGLEGLFNTQQSAALPFTLETGAFLQRPQPAPTEPAPAEPALAEPAPSAPLAPVAPVAMGPTQEQPTSQPQPTPPVAQAVAPEPPAPIAEPVPAAAPRGDDVYSIRTRTMARLLAEQGDYDGALDIYRELLTKARDDREREELDAIIERMQLMLRELPAAQALPPAAEVPGEVVLPLPDAVPPEANLPEEAAAPPTQEEATIRRPRKRPRSALERLAMRLERRAAG